MIRGGGRRGVLHDLAVQHAARERRRREEIIEADVGRPTREGVADVGTMEQSVDVDVTGIEHQLDCSPTDAAAAEPDQRPQSIGQLAEIEQIAWRQRVEVSGEEMKTLLMAGDAGKKRAQFDDAMPLRPR